MDGTTAQVVVTVTGADDAAVIDGGLAGAVTEDAQQTETSGTLTVSDPDAGQSAFTAQTKAGTYGTFTLGTDGEWTYTLDNTDTDTDALGSGQTGTDTFEVASADGTGAQVVITVTGSDDAAVIGGAGTGAVIEDAAATEASGTLTVNDPDAGEAEFKTQTDAVGTYGTFTLEANGAWTYTLDNEDTDTDALRAGQTVTDTFEVASVDGTTAQVVVTVTGADDAAQIGGDLTGSVTEDDASAATASGTLTVSDPDAGEEGFRISGEGRTVGRHGVFTLDADGEWTYTLDNASANALGAGQKVTDTFEVASVDGTVAQVVVTVTGADDAAVIDGGLAGAVTEDAQQTETSGTLTVSDPDAGQSAFTAQTKAGTYGTFTLGTDGEWTYTLDNADREHRRAGCGARR